MRSQFTRSRHNRRADQRLIRGNFGLAAGLAAGLVFGLLAGFAVGLLFGIMSGLGGVPGNLAAVTGPEAVLARDRQVMLPLMLWSALGAGLVAGLVGMVSVGLTAGLASGLVGGLVLGLMLGLVLGVTQTAWLGYVIARAWLALRHRLLWSLMGFLADAHMRGILRQAGAVYQFRHIELQHRLASRDENEQQANSSTD